MSDFECPLCGGDDLRQAFVTVYERSHYTDIGARLCRGCGIVFRPVEDDEGDDE